MSGALQTQGVPVLKCPGCGNRIADDTSICPVCDYIIDASFISSDSPGKATPWGEDDEVDPTTLLPSAGSAPAPKPVRTNAGARGNAPSRVTTSTGVKVTTSTGVRVTTSTGVRVKGNTGNRPAAVPDDDDTAPSRAASGRAPAAPRSTAPSGSRPAPPRRDSTELDPSDANYVPPRPPPTAVPNQTGQIMAPEELAADFKSFVAELGRTDKIVFISALVIIASAFLPWKETAADGDILGLMSLGILAVLAAGALVGTVVVRVRRVMPALGALVPWVVQLCLSIFCIVWCLVFMKISTNGTEVPSSVGKEIVPHSSFSFGVLLALLGALGCLAGTLMGLKEQRES